MHAPWPAKEFVMAFPRVTHLAIGAALAAGSLNGTVHGQFSTAPPADAAQAEDDAAPKGAPNAPARRPGARNNANGADPNAPPERQPWDTEENRVRMLKA